VQEASSGLAIHVERNLHMRMERQVGAKARKRIAGDQTNTNICHPCHNNRQPQESHGLMRSPDTGRCVAVLKLCMYHSLKQRRVKMAAPACAFDSPRSTSAARRSSRSWFVSLPNRPRRVGGGAIYTPVSHLHTYCCSCTHNVKTAHHNLITYVHDLLRRP
jgi:hypothetical protein